MTGLYFVKHIYLTGGDHAFLNVLLARLGSGTSFDFARTGSVPTWALPTSPRRIFLGAAGSTKRLPPQLELGFISIGANVALVSSASSCRRARGNPACSALRVICHAGLPCEITRASCNML
jgi:hypothetical protein